MDFGPVNKWLHGGAFEKNYPYTDNNVTYDTYSGTDIVAMILVPFEEQPLVLGELQTISYSIHRENTPVRTLGNVNPRGFVKGPRTIAGSLIFTQFNQYTFYRLQQYRQLMQQQLYGLADMLPPFDVILSFSNESGGFSRLKIYGVSIVDEGATMSVDDLMVEQTFTYMARGIQPLTAYTPSGVDKPTDTTYFSVENPNDINVISFRA